MGSLTDVHVTVNGSQIDNSGFATDVTTTLNSSASHTSTFTVNASGTEDFTHFHYSYSGDGTNVVDIQGSTGADTLTMGSDMSSHVHITGGGGTDTLHFTDAVGTSDDLSHVSAFSNIIFDNIGSNASETVGDSLFTSGQTLNVDAHTIDSSHALTFDASGVTGGYLYIQGGAGADTITGVNTNSPANGYSNVLFGGGGADTLTGGSGADLFLYKSLSDNGGDTSGTGGAGDTITNFTSGTDKFAFYADNAGGSFGYNTTTGLNSHIFTSTAGYNASGASTSPCWFLDDTGHSLMYDADGHGGGGAAVVIANNINSLNANTDIIIVDAAHHQVGTIIT